MITVRIRFSHSDFKRVKIASPSGKSISFYIDFDEREENKTSDELKALCYRAYKASEGKGDAWDIYVEISAEAMQEAFYIANPDQRPITHKTAEEQEADRKKRRKEFFRDFQNKQRTEKWSDR